MGWGLMEKGKRNGDGGWEEGGIEISFVLCWISWCNGVLRIWAL